MQDRHRDRLAQAAALLLGGLTFLVFAGWWVLLPGNLSWLGVGDRAMHMLGWMFFRATPWQFPPGLSPRLGIELSNSVALVDALPLFALPAKLFGAVLPQPFQYWGVWWLVCFSGQGLFAYLLAREWGATRLVALCAAAFALITPAFLFRLTLHMAHAAHFLLLAALWLYARREAPRRFAWPLLIVLTSLIHLYLLAMVAAIWAAALVERLWTRRMKWAAAAVEFLGGTLVALLAMYLAGVFTILGSTGNQGYGFYRLNLLAPIISYGSWSHLVPAIAHGDYDYEGLSFLGIGIFAALAFGLVAGGWGPLCKMAARRWLPLFAVIGLCWLFALSNRIGFADLGTRPIPLPPLLEALGEMFRSTGRFVWPLLYVVTIGTVVLLGRRLGNRWAVPLLVIALAAQAADSSAGWTRFRATIPVPAPDWTTAFVSPFWERAGTAGLTRLRAIPPIYRARDWLAAETFAVRHGLDTDAVYLGRVNTAALANLGATEAEALRTGVLEPDTLYLLDFASARQLAPHVQPADLFAVVDNRIVFARGRAYLLEGLDIDPHGAATIRSWLPPSIALITGHPD